MNAEILSLAGSAYSPSPDNAAHERLIADSSPNRNIIESAVHNVVGLVWSGDSEARSTTEGVASEFIKAVPLFMGGGRGLALTTLAYGLGEVKVNDSLEEQGLEFVAGMAKGFFTKKSFEYFGAQEWNFAKKGMAMGSSSRFLDTAFTPSNYLSNGNLDVGGGLQRAAFNAGDVKALTVDALTFGAAHFVPGVLPGKITRSALATSTITGASFGFTSGVLGELQNEWHNNSTTDWSKLLVAGGKEAAIMSAAAATGHSLTPRTAFVETDQNGNKGDHSLRTKIPDVHDVAKIPDVEDVAKAPIAQEVANAPIEKGTTNKPEVQTRTKELGGYTGYFLNDAAVTQVRSGLTIDGENIPLRWTPPDSMHVTEKFGVKESSGNDWAKNAAEAGSKIRVLGIATDSTGVEALHVSVDGRTVREDGKPYHITRSLAEGRKPFESMSVVEKSLAAESARTTGATGEMKPEDLARYSYRELTPEQQFDLSFEPRFQAGQKTEPKVKERQSKPEVKPVSQEIESPQVPSEKLESKKPQQLDSRELFSVGAMESIPVERDRVEFQKAYANLGEDARWRFADKLNEAVKNPDEVGRTTQIRGITFEMTRLERVAQQGMEKISDRWTATEPVKFDGYQRRATDFSQPPHHALNATIQSDIPIVRDDGRPYVYEVNASPRRLFGSDAQQRNQILKFEQAINDGTIAGATVEVNGRVSPDYVQWLTGKSVGDSAAAPNVEVLYNMTLPSGADYTFILKRAANNEGLRFTNADRAYTPEDRDVIRGIYKAVQDRSIGDIISGTNIDNPPAELAPFMADPYQIRDLNLFNEYDHLRSRATWDKLKAKADSDRINEANPRSATSEYNSRQCIDEATRWYQDHLRQNPQTSKAKSAYLIENEDGIRSVVELTYQRAQQVREYEEARATAPDAAIRQAERTSAGYTGRAEGVSLDMEHFIMDATQEQNKGGNRRGRTYDQPERFMNVVQVSDYLNGQDRRSVEVRVYDPLANRTDILSNMSEQQIDRQTASISAENVQRARQRVQENEVRYQELNEKQDCTPAEDGELKTLTSRHAGLANQKAAIERAEARIDSITQARKTSIEKKPANNASVEVRDGYIARMKERAAQFDSQIEMAREELQDRYRQVLGGEGEWNKIAKRQSTQEQNIIKFMYVVNADGQIPLTEEIVRGESAGRAAHSELAQGRNVYGAGELVFAKDPNTSQWRLVEINNASGHYRPPGAETLPYVRNLISQHGLDTSGAIINDALQRGTPLVDAHLLDAHGPDDEVTRPSP